MEISNLFTAGGVVMWPLLAFSLLGVALIIERIIFWVRINNRQNKVVREVLQLYRLDNVVSALNYSTAVATKEKINPMRLPDEAEVSNCKLVIGNCD